VCVKDTEGLWNPLFTAGPPPEGGMLDSILLAGGPAGGVGLFALHLWRKFEATKKLAKEVAEQNPEDARKTLINSKVEL
jgi:NADPH:quinone reductase-like Zn-dependent oxidoreductase